MWKLWSRSKWRAIRQRSPRQLASITDTANAVQVSQQALTNIEKTVPEARYMVMRAGIHISKKNLALRHNTEEPSGTEGRFALSFSDLQSDHHKVSRGLIEQLHSVRQDARKLSIEGTASSGEEWEILGQHLHHVTDLELESGFEEDLSDKSIPKHWPLERLLISSAVGEVVQNPLILEGRIKHLTLLLTHELRFTGPTTDQLTKSLHEAVERGDSQYDSLEGSKLKLISVPKLAAEWMMKNLDAIEESAVESKPMSDIKLERLEILENNAIETFCRMAFAIPKVVMNLKHLTLRSTEGNDFTVTHESTFNQILPQLTGLRELKIIVGDTFEDGNFVPTLYQYLPPNLVSFQFRGPVRLAQDSHWSNWVTSFADSEFLGSLRTLSFVLDQDYEDVQGRRKKARPTDKDLRYAQQACQGLFQSLKQRGVAVEPFREEWIDESNTCFDDVDPRWSV